MDEMKTATAAPYEARRCPQCDRWIYTAGGPFAESDRTKTLVDIDHWEREHADPADQRTSASGAIVTWQPYFRHNEESVEAIVEER